VLVEAVIADALKLAPQALIVIKSTIPVGFTDRMRAELGSDAIVFSPEFLREGRALYDNLHPSRIIVGDTHPRAGEFAGLLLDASLEPATPLLQTGNTEAEAIKLFANTYLAMRVAFFNELDTYAATHGVDSRQVIARLQARYASETGCRTLRIKHNSMLGYFVEVPQAVGEEFLKEPWRAVFVHRQTMSDAMRFSSLELGELEARIASAADRALKLELSVFAALVEAVLAQSGAIKQAAEALAAIDVAAALAELAAAERWVRPAIDGSDAFAIAGGRHPVVEAALKRDGKPFVANDADLSPPGGAIGSGGRICLITGPNMAGKSTFLRQNALIALMAQAGCFVPAAAARIGLVDRLFSRVGAADNLARGRSTFMVEMVETAAILAQATRRSFVILDEVGRGTSTYDGLALAWAVAEAVHTQIGCRCLFATHYHELARLAETCEALSLHHVRAREWQGDLVLLHELAEGPADRSYGLAVARLAGVPANVVSRAKAVLAKLEAQREATGGIAAGLGDLPLFANLRVPEPEQESPEQQLAAALRAADLDALTPREALDLLYEWKRGLPKPSR